MGRAHGKAAIIGRAAADPLFIVHLTDKQRIEANTYWGGGRRRDGRGSAHRGYCHVTKSRCIVNAMHV